MTSHHDVAARLRDPYFFARTGTREELVAAADFIESQANALSEAEGKFAKFEKAAAHEWFCGELGEIGYVGIRSFAAVQARLAEAMKIIEPLIEALEKDYIGEVCKDEDPNEPVALGLDGPTALTFGMIYAARAFINTAKEKT